VQYVQALAPSGIAIVAAFITGYIALRQWITAHHRLRLDLYERRFAVYDATKKLLATIGLHGQVTPDNLGEFYIGVRGAEFLFDGELRNFLMQIGDIGFRARMARSSWERRVSDPSVDKLIDEEEAILSFLHDQDRRLETMFSRYLDLSAAGL